MLRQAASTSRAAAPARTAATRELDLEQQVVQALLLGRGLAHDEAARHVGVVALDQRPDVDHHRVALLDHTVADLVMRAGGVLWPARHDRVVTGAVGPVAAHPVLQLVAYVGLGRPLGEQRRDLGQRRVGACAGGGDAGHLAGVLDAAGVFDHAVGRYERELGGERLPALIAEAWSSRRRSPARRRRREMNRSWLLWLREADSDVGVDARRLGLSRGAIRRSDRR